MIKKWRNMHQNFKKKKINTKILNFNSSNINLFETIKTFFHILRLIKKLDPDLIHSASMKANILSGLCCLIMSKPAIIAFSGFGYLFTDVRDIKTKCLNFLIKLLIKIIFLNKKKYIIVQNKFDYQYLKKNFSLNKKCISILNGSGAFIKKNKNNNKK